MNFIQCSSIIKTSFVSAFIAYPFFLISPVASAQSYEVACRAKAKEIAAETYRTCVTDNKQAQLKKIRSEYQRKLNDLKGYYDGELKKLKSGEITSSSQENMINNTAQSSPPSSKTKKQNRQDSHLEIKTRHSGARSSLLPEKEISTQTSMIQSYTNDEPPSAEPHPYGDEPEVIEMPIEN